MRGRRNADRAGIRSADRDLVQAAALPAGATIRSSCDVPVVRTTG